MCIRDRAKTGMKIEDFDIIEANEAFAAQSVAVGKDPVSYTHLMFDRKTYEKRVEWYQHDRFGMFIHWGLYDLTGWIIEDPFKNEQKEDFPLAAARCV